MPAITPEELAKIGKRLYGHRAWITSLARALGVRQSTVWRWFHRATPMSPPSANLIRRLDAEHRARKAAERAMRA